MSQLTVYYKVIDLVKTPHLQLEENAIPLYQKLLDHVQGKLPMELDFDGVLTMSNYFAHCAFGKLVKVVKRDDVKKYIKVINIGKEDLRVIRRILDATVQHQKIKTRLDKTMDKVELENKPKWEQKLIKKQQKKNNKK